MVNSMAVSKESERDCSQLVQITRLADAGFDRIKGFLLELERKLRQRAPKRQNDIVECRLPAAQGSTGEISVRILLNRVFISIWWLLRLGKPG